MPFGRREYFWRLDSSVRFLLEITILTYGHSSSMSSYQSHDLSPVNTNFSFTPNLECSSVSQSKQLTRANNPAACFRDLCQTLNKQTRKTSDMYSMGLET